MPQPHLELLALMEEISEDGYSASWMSGLALSLWKIVENGQPVRYGQIEISSDLIAKLNDLREAAGGWWAWSSEFDEAVFVPTAAWRRALELRGGS